MLHAQQQTIGNGDHATVTASTPSGITIDFDITDVQTAALEVGGKAAESLTLEGEGFVFEPGMPNLPAVTRFVVVPAEAGLQLVVHADQPRGVRSINPPQPCFDDGEGEPVEWNYDGRHGIYPAVAAEMSEPTVIRGVRLVKISSYPVRYDFDSHRYLYHENISAEIRYTDDEPVNPARLPVRRNRSQHFLKFIRGLAINADEVGRDDPDRDREPEYTGHYLIATRQEALQYAAPFIEWRRKSGWKVDILSLTPNQGTSSNTVKNLIQERYNAYLEDGIDPFDHLLLIGDHESHDNCGPNSQWIIAADRGNPSWPHNTNHYDWLYACLEGGQNDIDADVAISRWPSGNQELMRVFTHKHLSYETDPYREDTDWFKRGAVYSQRWAGNYHISLATNVRWAKHVLESHDFDDVRTIDDADVNSVGQFISRQFDAGVNVMLGRAENYYYRSSFVNFVNASPIFPIDLNIAGHHEWSTWRMLREPTMNDLCGPVAASTGWGGPQTLWNSISWLEAVNGFMLRDLTWGWARVQSSIAPDGYIPNFSRGIFPYGRTDIVFYGDPGIQWWRDVPLEVEAEFVDEIALDTRIIEVRVTDAEEGNPVDGGQVTVYAPGDMPAFNHANYANYDDMFMLTTKSNEEGFARFIFDNDVEFERGTMFLTVSGRDILPLFEEIDMRAPQAGIALSSFELTESEGNEDDVVNPGETFALSITAENQSDDAVAEGVTAVVTSLSPYVEVENGELDFGDIDPEDEVTSESIATLIISPVCPDGETRPITRPALLVEFRSGDDIWQNTIKLMPVAPNFEVRSIVGGIVVADSIDEIDIDLDNIGGLAAPASRARLISRGMGISVVEAEREYPEIASGDHERLDDDRFVISGNRVVVPGSRTRMALVIETESGFIDTAYFELQVREPRTGAPQGPDAYGYICFDDTDQNWDIAPEYEWIEISTIADDPDFRGTRLNFRGNVEIGEVLVVDLPFETQFYGRLFDQITVASNGFISMGSQDYSTNFQNWPMDRAIGGGVGMLAPLWDDLRLPGNNSGIFYYYNDEEHYFVVEWYRLTHRNGGGADLTFQVILYDHEIWVTETGDQNILFQYKEVRDVQGRNDNWSTASPYASVGISSPYGDTGLNYSFNNARPITSAPLENRRALLFSTSPKYKACVLEGVVTDAATNQPVSEAIIVSEHGFTAYTDQDGFWRITNALAEVAFDITCLKLGYNDSTLFDLEVAEDDTMEINFNLLHPEFTPTDMVLGAALAEGEATQIPFEVFNGGNGPLEWRVERQLRGDANADPWEFRRDYNVGAVIDDNRMEGVAFIDDLFYITGHADDPTIYVVDREGELIDSYPQPGADQGYMRDLTWDGELLWGCAARQVIGFTLEGDIVNTFEAQYNPNTALTWDPVQEVLWITSTTADPVAYDREGNRVSSLNRRDLRIYGLGYWVEDPDGFPLYIYNSPSGGAQVVTKMNPATNDTMFVRILEASGRPGGAFITNQFDVYSWVFMTLANDGANDRIDIWQLDVRRDWMQVDPIEGMLNTGETQDFTLTLDATGLPPVLFVGDLVFTHNAENGETRIGVELNVLAGPGEPDVRTVSLEEGWNVVSLNVETEVVDIPQMMQPLVDAGSLVIIKDGRGRFYNPAQGFNNIPRWGFSDGYQIYLTDPAEIEFEGLVIAPDEPIALEEGWNLKSYYPRIAASAITALEGIRDQLTIAKDGYGHFYMPRFEFSSIGDLQEGRGYFYKVSEPVELVYSIEERGAALQHPAPQPVHFEATQNTGVNHSVLVFAKDVAVGSELAAVTSSGLTAGAGAFDGSGKCGFAVWTDNPATPQLDGFTDGDPMTFLLWNGTEEFEVAVEPVMGDAYWTADGILVGSLKDADAMPTQFGIAAAYPNPFNSTVRLTYGLIDNNNVKLRVFDLSGRLIATLTDDAKSAGWHTQIWDASTAPSGVYWLRLDAAGESASVKVVLMR